MAVDLAGGVRNLKPAIDFITTVQKETAKKQKTHTKRVSFIACSARHMGFELRQVWVETLFFKTIIPTNNYYTDYTYYKFSMSNSLCLRSKDIARTKPSPSDQSPGGCQCQTYPDLRFKTCPGSTEGGDVSPNLKWWPDPPGKDGYISHQTGKGQVIDSRVPWEKGYISSLGYLVPPAENSNHLMKGSDFFPQSRTILCSWKFVPEKENVVVFQPSFFQGCLFWGDAQMKSLSFGWQFRFCLDFLISAIYRDVYIKSRKPAGWKLPMYWRAYAYILKYWYHTDSYGAPLNGPVNG